MEKMIIDWAKIERQMMKIGIKPATKAELAKRAGLAELTISNVTRGRVGWSSKTLQKIADTIEVEDPRVLITIYKDV